MTIVANATNNTVLSSSLIDTALSAINPLIIKILVAVLILLIGVVLGKIVEKLLLKIFDLADLNTLLTKFLDIKASYNILLSKIIFYTVLIYSVVLSMNQLSLTKTFVLIAAIVLGALLITFFIFGINDVLVNFFVGLYMRLKNDMELNDYILIKDKKKNIEGRIISISLVNIQIETDKDEKVFVPFMVMFKSSISIKSMDHLESNRNKNSRNGNSQSNGYRNKKK